MALTVFGLGTPLMAPADAMAQITFDTPVYYQIPGSVTIERYNKRMGSVAVGDFNNDGWLDIVTASAAEGQTYGGKRQVGVFLNDQAGGFSNASVMIFDQLCHNLAVADFDGDHTLDLVVGESKHGNPNDEGRIIIMQGQGDGTFVEMGRHEFDRQVTDITTGDVDDDGDVDIVAAVSGRDVFRTKARIHHFSNSGDGTFEQVHQRDTGKTRIDAVTLGDLDGDGDLEVALSNHNTSENDYGYYGAPCHQRSVTVGEIDGSLQWVELPSEGPCYSQYSWDARWGTDILMNDVDGDGDLDVLVSHANPSSRSDLGYQSSVVTLLNDGSGSVTMQPQMKIGGQTYNNTMAMGDLEGDGDIDVVMTSAKGRPGNFVFTVGENIKNDTTMRNLFSTPAYKVPVATALGDFDGDGQLDAVALVYEPMPGIVVCRNTTPRQGPTLEQSALIRGERFRLKVTNATPGKLARFLYAFGPPDNSVGLKEFGGITIDLGDPLFYLDRKYVGDNGEAILNRKVPQNAPLRGVTIQAVIRQGANGFDSVKTNPIYSWIQ